MPSILVSSLFSSSDADGLDCHVGEDLVFPQYHGNKMGFARRGQFLDVSPCSMTGCARYASFLEIQGVNTTLPQRTARTSFTDNGPLKKPEFEEYSPTVQHTFEYPDPNDKGSWGKVCKWKPHWISGHARMDDKDCAYLPYARACNWREPSDYGGSNWGSVFNPRPPMLIDSDEIPVQHAAES
eukprot:gnl/MRDRNA2_/MRDRNA2_46378_c0_seq1.p1 gnl/MRDRNA2_/MRDRNA2_46378_c0~~gnl/MRDRNA2_/MRDRNA2_46378_c0_seq1.p1  ORF type:complete len:183 (-),score=17.50 gnl/MRDRNA2_/MRDRNA2_46378_c0_seq1:66-614(-)